jgi:mercuric reductase
MPEECCVLDRGQENVETTDVKPDLLIVGGGSAAFSAAITAAEMDARVVMAAEGTIGGTCVNIGCVPSKTLIRAMQAVHDGKNAARFDGVRGVTGISDWKAFVRQKQALVDGLRKAKYEDLLPEYPNISYVRGRARFTGNGTEVEVEGTLYHPRKVILATGSSPALPPIDGIQSVPVLDSTKALELEKLPESLLVIGGGIIGCELGQMFARAGVKVTICCRSRLLPDAEPEVSEALADYLRQEGVAVCQGVGYQRIEQSGKGIALTCQTPDGERVIQAEQVLAATGRRPNTKNLLLANAGIALNGNGGIAVNEYMQTGHPNVYAVGDVTGQDMFVYMAAYGGKLAAINALEGNERRYDNAAMPSVVFTDPQVATAGLTEAEAKARGHDVKASLITLDNVPRHIAARDTRGLIKLVADRKTDKLLGATILAPEAGDSIQTVVMALKASLTTEELADTIFPYLTAVEGVKLAAQTFKKDVKKLSCCAG